MGLMTPGPHAALRCGQWLRRAPCHLCRVIYVVPSMPCLLSRAIYAAPYPGIDGQAGSSVGQGGMFPVPREKTVSGRIWGLHPGSVPRRDHATADLSPGAARTGASSAGLGLGFFRMSCHGALKMDRPAPPVPVDAGAMMLDPQGHRFAALPGCTIWPAHIARPTLPGFMNRPNRGHRDDI